MCEQTTKLSSYVAVFMLQVLFDSNGCIKRFNSVEEILKEFFELRMLMYKKRKDYLEGMLAAESLKLDNIARFILEKIEGTITIGELVLDNSLSARQIL